MKYFNIVCYDNYIYQLKDKLGVLTTLIVGSEKALLIDTAYGIGNLKEEVLNILDNHGLKEKDLIVINSHGHMDHTNGNFMFDKVYILEEDYELLKEHNQRDVRQRNIDNALNSNLLDKDFDIEGYLNQGIGNIEFLHLGDVFDLGNIRLEVIGMEGHTKGSIGLYDKDNKNLFVSDATCPFVWMFLKESLRVSDYIKMLKRIIELDFDYFYTGHNQTRFKKEKMHSFLKIAEEIDLEKSVPVSFGGFEDCHAYCYTKGKMYDQNDCGIVFDPDKL